MHPRSWTNCLVSLQKMEMPVASATDPSIVAGALAARVREGAEVYLTAIGVDAVGNAMRAICFARLYLEVSHLQLLAVNGVCCPKPQMWQKQ